MAYPENETNKKSKFGFLIIILGFVVLVALGGLVVFLWSVSPVAVLILIGLCFVVGVPVVAGILLLIVIAEAGDDGWSKPDQFFNWDTVPKIRDRWPRDKL